MLQGGHNPYVTGKYDPKFAAAWGQIATMLTSVTRTRSPLQRELDTLTKVLGVNLARGILPF